MSKFGKCTVRRDGLLQDHQHSLPDGSTTRGMHNKPNANARAGWHTHIYMHEGMVEETDATYDGPGHVHDSALGVTSGPMPVQKNGQGVELARTDSLRREGAEWVIRSPQGRLISRGHSRLDALSRAPQDVRKRLRSA